MAGSVRQERARYRQTQRWSGGCASISVCETKPMPLQVNLGIGLVSHILIHWYEAHAGVYLNISASKEPPACASYQCGAGVEAGYTSAWELWVKLNLCF